MVRRLPLVVLKLRYEHDYLQVEYASTKKRCPIHRFSIGVVLATGDSTVEGIKAHLHCPGFTTSRHSYSRSRKSAFPMLIFLTVFIVYYCDCSMI